ncbi:MAG: sigma-54 dependent transcriptional regulator [Bacteroidota bacterium]
MERILIIDDDHDICLLLQKFLKKNDFDVEFVNTGEDAVKLLKKATFDLIISDYRLPDDDGISLLKKIMIIDPNAAVVMITGYSDVRIAVESLKHGAYDYVTKPLYPDEILVTIREALKKKNVPREVVTDRPKEDKVSTGKLNKFIKGESNQAQLVQKHIDLIAPTDMSVVITGETGTGKEFVANAIHEKSLRSNKPFVAIDCGALPQDLAGSELFGHKKGAFTGATTDKKGSFELANGGTLFLDEIGNLTYDNQIKLLRVLQERKIKAIGGIKDIEIDVRVIAATNEDLKQAVKEGRFREDIYHRLNEFKIELSPLRHRKSDIMIFANHFLELANAQLNKRVSDFEKVVQERLEQYYWHGNLRELQNVVKRAVLLCQQEMVTLDCLPSEIVLPDLTLDENEDRHAGVSKDINLKSVSENAEKRAIVDVLEQTGYNKTKAAEVLKIDRKTLYNKLKAYQIEL